MALSSTDLQRKLTDIVECPICSDTLSCPKILPCIHAFCLGCLENYGKGKKPEDKVACPLCRAEFLIPSLGLSGLPNNFFLENLAKMSRISQRAADGDIPCGICSEDGGAENTICAKLFCIECGQHMCEQCAKLHKRMKGSSVHSVVEHGSQLKPDDVAKFQTRYCQVHRSDEVKLFCSDCRQCVCMVCYAEHHSGHKCVDVNKAAGDFRKQLQTDFIDKIDAHILQEQKKKKGNYEPKQKDVFKQKVLKIESEINKSAEEMKKAIDRHVRNLIKELHLIRNVRLAEIETGENNDKKQSLIADFRKYLQEIKDKGSVNDVFQTIIDPQVRSRVDDYQCASDNVDDVGHVEIKFISRYLGSSSDESNRNIVGEISLQSANSTTKLPGKCLASFLWISLFCIHDNCKNYGLCFVSVHIHANILFLVKFNLICLVSP